MIRATTPTFILTLPSDIDQTEATNIYVTFAQPSQDRQEMDFSLTKTGEDLEVDKNVVNVYLTQEDTLHFISGRKVLIQMNWIFGDGTRAASEIASVIVRPNLIPEVKP